MTIKEVTMGNRKMVLLFGVLALCVIAVSPGLTLAAVNQNAAAMGDRSPDPLQRLSRALSDVGGTALTTAQQTALQTLISDFQNAVQPSPSAARLSYDNYILLGDEAKAVALLPTLEAEQAAEQQQRRQSEVTFAVFAVKLLLADQVAVLQKQLGIDGLVRLIESLAGGPGGHGH